MFRKILRITSLGLLFSLVSPYLVSASPLSEVQDIIRSGYVDPVDSSVFEARTIEETLDRLGDPYTDYFTPEEYQEFLNSMDMTFSGIGVYVKMVPEGVLITSVIPNSPASEVGLQQGDIITKADGKSLAGLSQEKAVAILKGPEGTKVEIVIIRGEERLSKSVVRRSIEVPTVQGQIFNKHIGYIAIETFGDSTTEAFKKMVEDYKSKGVDSWIIDLRNNPGGYLDTALELAGFFIGDETAVKIKYRNKGMESYPAKKQGVLLTEPTVFLTNEYSASASELLAAAVKDYEKAVVVGDRTYGKGSVQTMFSLSDGGVLKMTVAKFHSPEGNAINILGVNPDLPVVENDALLAALLLLEGDSNDMVQLSVGSKEWTIDLEEARKPEYWETYGEIVGNSLDKTSFTFEDFTKEWPLYYPDYKEVSVLEDISLDKKFTIKFSDKVNWDTVTEESFELIESKSGERVPLDYEPINDVEIIISPKELLEEDKTYWLVTHTGIRGIYNEPLRKGVVAIAHT